MKSKNKVGNNLESTNVKEITLYTRVDMERTEKIKKRRGGEPKEGSLDSNVCQTRSKVLGMSNPATQNFSWSSRAVDHKSVIEKSF